MPPEPALATLAFVGSCSGFALRVLPCCSLWTLLAPLALGSLRLWGLLGTLSVLGLLLARLWLPGWLLGFGVLVLSSMPGYPSLECWLTSVCHILCSSQVARLSCRGHDVNATARCERRILNIMYVSFVFAEILNYTHIWRRMRFPCTRLD